MNQIGAWALHSGRDRGKCLVSGMPGDTLPIIETCGRDATAGIVAVVVKTC